ncbi:ABC transporter ATP-binding protein [Micromonospora fluostatini]|uniref:ABC transporter ATP-binding protein n=1 Tax=Micromonospora fluostatini TaxID=1629071 RepID=A0ABY2DG61_9ACTN|nr:ABC transporter ATP-binding protein [Micromonospora fluostatini]
MAVTGFAPLRRLTGSSLARMTVTAGPPLAVTAAWTVAGVAVTLLLPAAVAAAVDRAFAGTGPGLAFAALVALVAAKVLAEAAGLVSQARAVTRVLARVRHLFVRRLFALGIAGTRRHDDGDLLARFTGNTAAAAHGVPSLVTVVVEGAASVGGLVALCLIDWWLGVTFLVGIAPAVLLLRLMMRRVRSRYGDYLRHQGDIAARFTDALTGSRTIQASRTQRRETERILAPLPALAEAGRQTWRVQGDISWQLDLVLAGLRVLVLGVGGVAVVQGRITPGQFLAASLYLGFALGFIYLSDTLAFLAHAQANAGRVDEILDQPPPQPGPSVPAAGGLPAGAGRLDLRGVTVRHDGHPVLDHVDLTVPAGTTVAVVGRSGAGKSTLALVAGGLLRPDEGEVRLDGVPLDALAATVLRREVGYAFDRPVLLGTTVADALAYGRPGTSGARVQEAARTASALDFLRRLPDGVDTPLARVPLSGGELQRLGLARALVHGGRLMILDDATSSLDTVTEARVTAALTTGLAGRTRLVVAHRVATAAQVDAVAWLDGGRIRAVAPHRDLWARYPDYRAVFTAGSTP